MVCTGSTFAQDPAQRARGLRRVVLCALDNNGLPERFFQAMTAGHVFIASSLDGYIARKDGLVDWLMKQKTEGEDHGYDALMASVDGLVMGRGAFENVLAVGITQSRLLS